MTMEDTQEDTQPYLRATETIECDHPRVLERAADISKGGRDLHEVAARLFLFVRDRIRYSPYCQFSRREHYRATATLDRGQGFCVQKAVVLASLARAVRIPARLGFADIRNHLAPTRLVEWLGSDVFVFHCYTELYLKGRWTRATPAFDAKLCMEYGYPLVSFDGRNDAVFPARDEEGRSFVDYLRYHGAHADVPLEEMLRALADAYGAQRVEGWKRESLP